MASATTEANNSAYNTIVAGTGHTFIVKKAIPGIRKGLEIQIGTELIAKIHPRYGTLYFSVRRGGEEINQITPENIRTYLTTEYLELKPAPTEFLFDGEKIEHQNKFKVIKGFTFEEKRVEAGMIIKVAIDGDYIVFYVYDKENNLINMLDSGAIQYLTKEYLVRNSAGGRRKLRRTKKQMKRRRRTSRR